MKNYLFVLVAVVLMVSGCSKEEDAPVVLPDNVVARFTPDNAGPDIVDFFSSELPVTRIYHGPRYQEPTVWEADSQVDTCVIINSTEELQAFYHGVKPLPKIDFTSQSLIIGWKQLGTSADLEKLDLVKGVDGYSLDVYTVRYKPGLYSPTAVMLDYWALFPKLPVCPSETNIIVEWREGNN